MTFATTGWGQTSTQNFGTTAASNTSATGNTTTIPNPTLGTTYARGGATAPAAPINVSTTTPNPLGTTGAYLKAVASATTAVSKATPISGYTASTEFYTSFKVLFGDSNGSTTATSGIWKFLQGTGATYTDNNDFATAQTCVGLQFTYGASGAVTLNYRSTSGWVTTSLTSSAMSQGTVYTIEIMANNKSSGTISYTYNGVSRSVAVQKFDLYVNGSLVGDDISTSLLTAGSTINATTFTGISSTSNVANIFVDDFVVYNAIPGSIGVTSSPGAPAITGITPGNTQLSVAFTPPSSDGGSAITNYKYSTDAGSTFTAVSPAATTSPITISGLSNGTAYNVQIKAVNNIGDGTATGSTAATPRTTPSAPTITGITAGNGSLSVAFTAASDGGSAITNYKYTTDGSTWTAAGVTTSPIAITGLSNGTSYNVQIRAVNVAGDGTVSTITAATPRTTPSAPTISSITPGNGSLSVAFTAGATGGSAITNYKYTTDGSTWTAAGVTTSPIAITGLSNGTSYNVQIRAVNVAGDGTVSTITAATPRTTPAAPTSLALTAGNGQLTASFTAPASTGGSAITNYEYSTNGGSTFTAVSPASTSTSIVITSLLNGTSYDVQIRAVNAAGSGTATGSVSGTPTAPASPQVTVSGLSGTLSTTYGTPSGERSFTVSGFTLSGDLTVTAPTGLAVSTTSGSGFGDSLTLAASSQSVSNTTIYVRLKASAAAGSYNSVNISITGGGDDKNVTTSSTGNTVTAKTIAITGLAFENKVYDRTTTASATGTAALSGVESGDTAYVTLGGTPAYSFATSGVGTAIVITTTGYSISGSASGNYSLTQPSGNANITVAPLMVSGASATERVYNTLTTVAIAGGTLSGVIAGDAVSLGGSPTGTVGTAAPGDGKPVTVTGFSISGASAGNYSLSQPTGLTVNIAKASQTILGVATTLTKTFGDVAYSLGASVASGETLSYSSDNSAVATVSSAGLVTIVGVGSANISVSQAGNDNYSAATTVTQALTVNKANQTITFSALANKATTDAPFALTATTTATGLTVSYTSSNPAVATVSGNMVTLVGVGTTTITASQVGNSNYNAATDVTQSLFVNPPPTALAAGDIAFLQYDSDNPDKFTFITLVDLAAGTVINFTDNGFASATTGRTGEGFLTFTVPNGTTYTAGSVFTWTNAMTVTGTPWSSGTPTNLAFNSGGDQLFAFQGSTANWDSQTGITLVAGLIQSSTAWITTGTAASATSYQPSGLSSSCIVIFGTDNAYFANGTTTSTAVSVSGTKAELQGLFFDGTNKWYKNSIGPLTAPTFTIALKQSQALSFSSIPAKTYGDAAFNLTATASSGLTVSYASSDTSVATVSGSAVTILKAGSTVITASQAGNSSYAAATSVPQTLTVSKATQTITLAATDSKTYGGIYMDFDLTATKGASTSALSYSSSNTGVATIHPTTGSVHIVGAGTTILTVNQAADANYNAAPAVTQTLTVGKAAITLAADAKSKAYGAADPDLTYTITSGALVPSDVLTGGLSRAPGANVGTYAISSTLANANYDVTFVPASLTITAATVASSDITMTPAGDGSYTASATGGASFTYSYVGRNQTSYGPSATAPTGAGFYSVTATANGNYSGSKSADFSITGPMAIADSLTKPADNEPYMIPVSELLTNDFRITSTSGATVTTGLSVTAVTGGAGNTASYNVGDRFIQFTPSSGASDTFTYSVTDGVSTATATVTVTTETQAPTFNLQIVKVGTAIFAGGNTTVRHDFIAVPNQTYLVEYATDLNGTWTSAGNQSTGTTGSFSVTFTTSGDVAADWTAHMFFRARLVR